jgi:hypothetical protein
LDADRFAHWTRLLPTPPSRRMAVRALAVLGLSALSGHDVAAKKKGGQRGKCKKCKKTEQPPCPTYPSAALPRPVVVACPGPRDNAISSINGERHAQTFTASHTGQIISAQVELVTGGAGHGYTLDIRTLDNAGGPSATILASKRIANAPAATETVPVSLIANLDPFVPVQEGTGYALVVTPDPGKFMTLGFRTSSDACPGQHFATSSATGPFFLSFGEIIFSVTIVV